MTGRAQSARSSRGCDWPPDVVSDAARASGTTIAVVIPARNEAATIGKIVAGVRSLPGDLVDELVVVDSASDDDTAPIAAAAGATVISLADVLAHVPPRPGKGEAMWRGLAATTSSLVVFIDGDLIDFDPGIVAALAGPLIADRSLVMVKGSYERPGSDPRRPLAAGGRVTELMARPLIGAFWPELAGILQPLGGEYALRRALVERLPFRCGYGVDLGLLVDAARLAGPDAIGQVDLGIRLHRNAELTALGRMSAEVLHTALDRLGDEGRLTGLERSAIISQPRQLADGLVHDLSEIDTAERPPLVEVRNLLATDRALAL